MTRLLLRMTYQTITPTPNARTAVPIPIPAFVPAPRRSFGVSVGLPEVEEFEVGCKGIEVAFDVLEEIELEDETADDITEKEEEELDATVEDADGEEFEGAAEKKQFPNPLWHPAPQ